MDHVRLFVAVPAPAELGRELALASARLKQMLAASEFKLRPVPVQNLHLTLLFLGETPRSEIAEIHRRLSGVASRLPVPEISLSGGGTFPGRGRPRVAWCGVEDRGAMLEYAAQSVGRVLERPVERYKPHFTLAYIRRQAKGQAGPENLRNAVAEACRQFQGQNRRCATPQFVLFESKLQPGGALHTALHTYSFAMER